MFIAKNEKAGLKGSNQILHVNQWGLKRLKFRVIMNSLPILDDGDEKENRIWLEITLMGEW